VARLFERWFQPRAVQKKSGFLDRIRSYLKDHQISTLPVIMGRLMELAKDPNASARDYAQVCELDQSSCMRILRLANSVSFGPMPGQVIRTVKDSIVRIGFDKTREVLHTSVVASLFRSREEIADYTTSDLWLNSAAVALGNRIIYGLKRECQSPSIDPYLAGLLRNIGIPVLHLCLYDFGFKDAILMRYQNQSVLIEEEVPILGVDHASIGQELAEQWKCAEALVTVIGSHHAPALHVKDPAIETLVHVTRTSEWLAHELGMGYRDFSDKHAPFYQASRNKIQLFDIDYARIKVQMTAEINQMRELMWFR